MKNRKGITLIEVIVVIAIIILLLAIVMPQLGRVKKIPPHIWCGVNLKSLGTAMFVYANDYDENFPQLPGTGPWSKKLGFAYDLKEPDFSPNGEQGYVERTITSSWYLLVRQSDASPRSFVCPAAVSINNKGYKVNKYSEFDDSDPNDQRMFTLWDFGPNPYKHVSYAMHNPYGKFPADSRRNMQFAVAADMSPWFNDGDIVPPSDNSQPPQIIKLIDETTWKLGNSLNHPPTKNVKGQKVLWGDGHVSNEILPNVGVNKDNIYTFQSTDKDPTEQDIQGGMNPTGRGPENDAKSEDDSFLAI